MARTTAPASVRAASPTPTRTTSRPSRTRCSTASPATTVSTRTRTPSAASAPPRTTTASPSASPSPTAASAARSGTSTSRPPRSASSRTSLSAASTASPGPSTERAPLFPHQYLFPVLLDACGVSPVPVPSALPRGPGGHWLLRLGNPISPSLFRFGDTVKMAWLRLAHAV